MPRWSVAAEFFTTPDAQWLDDFIHVPGLAFTKIPATRREDWHSTAQPKTGLAKWLRLFGQGARAFAGRPDGIITCFPQLAMVVAVIKRLTFRKTKIIAHNFNLGGFPSGPRQALARFAAKAIDIIVVHAPSEVQSYADYLGLPPSRIRFIPLQRGWIDLPRAEDPAQPFLLAMGSAGRDYATLIAATMARAIPTVIVTRADIIAGLDPAPHVTFRHGLSPEACLDLLTRARLTVVPVGNLATASGQVTFINAMMLGTPLVATRCPGTEGYVEDGATGRLVPPFDVAAMEQAIAALWDDPAARADLAARARTFARAALSDEAAAARLQGLIAELG